MNRRQFIKNAVIGAGALTLPLSANTAGASVNLHGKPVAVLGDYKIGQRFVDFGEYYELAISMRSRGNTHYRNNIYIECDSLYEKPSHEDIQHIRSILIEWARERY